MTMFYGNYDAEAKQSIMTTVQSTPDLRFPSGTHMIVQPIFNNFTQPLGPPSPTLVTAAVPRDEPFDCHGCGRLIGMAVFTRSGANWVIEASNQAITNEGQFGKPPTEIQSIEIGPSRSAVRIDDSGSGQGETTKVVLLLLPWHGGVSLALERIVADDDAGTCGIDGGLPCYSNHRTITFMPGKNANYYDIELRLEGSDLSDALPYKAIQITGLEKLTLQDGKYRQLFREGNLTTVDRVVAERGGLK
jgi:hypothetical protein